MPHHMLLFMVISLRLRFKTSLILKPKYKTLTKQHSTRCHSSVRQGQKEVIRGILSWKMFSSSTIPRPTRVLHCTSLNLLLILHQPNLLETKPSRLAQLLSRAIRSSSVIIALSKRTGLMMAQHFMPRITCRIIPSSPTLALLITRLLQI